MNQKLPPGSTRGQFFAAEKGGMENISVLTNSCISCIINKIKYPIAAFGREGEYLWNTC